MPVWNEWLDAEAVPDGLQADIDELGMMAKDMFNTPEGARFMEKSKEIMAKIYQGADNFAYVVKMCLQMAKQFITDNPKLCMAIFLGLVLIFVDLIYASGKCTKASLVPVFQLLWSHLALGRV